MSFIADFLEDAEALRLKQVTEAPIEAQVEAVKALIGEHRVEWCPVCATFRSYDCPVCRAREALEKYREQTDSLAEGLERRPRERDAHKDPAIRTANPGEIAAEIMEMLYEAREVRALEMAMDRAKKERQAVRRLTDGNDGRTGA